MHSGQKSFYCRHSILGGAASFKVLKVIIIIISIGKGS